MTRFLAILALTCLVAGTAGAADNRYGNWQEGGGDTQELVDRLRQLTQEAEEARAADRRFLADLWALIDEYDNPWTQTLISDAFRDGDYTRDPRWTLASGNARVDDRLGLVTSVEEGAVTAARDEAPARDDKKDPGAELAMALLGSLLEEAQKGRQQDSEPAPAPARSADKPATLYTEARVPDGFALTLDLEALSRDGQYIIEVYRDRPGGDGYAVIYRPGDQRPFELVRTSRDRTAVVEAATGAKPGGAFELTWTRKPGGEMTLAVNGNRLFKVRDRTWKDGFQGLALTTLKGRFALRRVELLGAGS